MVQAVGIDARLRGGTKPWIVVVVEDGHLHAIEAHPAMDTIMVAWPDGDAYVVDLPLGHEGGAAAEGREERAVDDAMRHVLGPRAEGVVWEGLGNGGGPVAARTVEARQVAADDDRVHEGHPELSFHVLKGTLGGTGPLVHRTGTLEGLRERLGLLHEAGLRPMRSFGGVGLVEPKTVLDATVLAWSAERVVAGTARTFPEGGAGKDPRTGRTVLVHA